MTSSRAILGRAIGWIAFGLMGVLIGVMNWMCLVSFQQDSKVSHAQAEVSEWPTVEGTLLQAHLVETPRTEFRVKYEYQFGGVRYTNDVFSIERIVMSRMWYKEQVRQLRQQQNSRGSVTVYFDPKDPSRSVLYAGTDLIASQFAANVTCVILTLLVTVPYVWGCLVMLKSLFKSPAEDELPVVQDFP